MSTKQILASIVFLSALLTTPLSRADFITATNSGSWGDPTVWDSNTVPGTNDFVEIDPPYNIIVDSNAIVQYIVGNGVAGGTVTMTANSTLEILDASATGTYQLGQINTTAPGNTVIYRDNPFYAKHQNYWNLVFNNTTTNMVDFYNGNVNTLDPSNNMTIYGDMTMMGKVKVQQGADFTINGNLTMGTNAQWDCSVANLSVGGDTILSANALLLDGDAAHGSNYFGGNLTVSATAIGWNISDVTTWGIGKSLTNNGTIVGKGYGSIAFEGTGTIAGTKPIRIPTMTVDGTYKIANTITLITNTPTLNGTLIFDLVNTNQIVLLTNAGTSLYYSGNLNVINSGPAPVAGASYKLFVCTNGFAGVFASTSFPSLPGGLSWVDNTLTTGSIDVVSSNPGSPLLTISRNGTQLTLSWDSATFPGYSIQAQTNSGVTTNWSGTTSGTVSPYVTSIGPTNKAVFYRLSKP